MKPADTSQDSWDFLLSRYRMMSVERRFACTLQAIGFVRNLMIAGVQTQFPQYSKQELKRELIRRWLQDDALFNQAFGQNKDASDPRRNTL